MLKMTMPLIGGFFALLVMTSAKADWAVNMPVGVTDISAETYDLHMMVLGVCTIIGIVVFGLIIYALVNFRKSKDVEPATFSHNTIAEIVWIVVPTLIIIAMAVPSAKTLVKIEDNRNTEMTIKITGYQWKWHYEYIDQGVSFYSSLDRRSNEARRLNSGIDPETVENYLLEVDNRLIVPVDTKIRYLLTSNDVLHAWWVPEIAIKKDAVPGFINEGWFRINEAGIYRGQCAELCGKDHGFMPVVVEALPKDEYRAWVDSQNADAPGAIASTNATTPAQNAAGVL
jgi:cytochrome c oxidase subunit 2